jgi:hypothetical protein
VTLIGKNKNRNIGSTKSTLVDPSQAICPRDGAVAVVLWCLAEALKRVNHSMIGGQLERVHG